MDAMNRDPQTDVFLQEYSTDQAVKKYSSETAGWGINYLLDHDYSKVYTEIIRSKLPPAVARNGARILEFGCGAGMNLLHMYALFEQNGMRVTSAIGTDFSPTMIEAAQAETARAALGPGKVPRFVTARNETLVEDLARGLGVGAGSLAGSLDFIFGVNTIRYCHRAKKEVDNARDIFDLLDRGGVCAVIDMNPGFPLFRSRLRDRLHLRREDYYLPSLAEYARPFETTGFEILRKETFCWVPHSAGPLLASTCKAATPVLNRLFPSRAMRCLVVARKPA